MGAMFTDPPPDHCWFDQWRRAAEHGEEHVCKSERRLKSSRKCSIYTSGISVSYVRASDSRCCKLAKKKKNVDREEGMTGWSLYGMTRVIPIWIL